MHEQLGKYYIVQLVYCKGPSLNGQQYMYVSGKLHCVVICGLLETVVAIGLCEIHKCGGWF